MKDPSKHMLKSIFHYDEEVYNAEYKRRFNDPDTIHLNIEINGNPAFICQTVDMYKTLYSIQTADKRVIDLCKRLPGVALDQFARRCLIDEIVLTNNIEGVNSTRKEINDVLSNLSKKNKRQRFYGLVNKYNVLMTDNKIKIKTCEDIRSIYDEIFINEIKQSDPENIPDGKIFRKSPVSVYSSVGKEIHKGLYPEKEIIKAMDMALDILNDSDMDFLIRTCVFHYLFGYIHPFYDGNGRTSRFISSYLLSRALHRLIGFRLSYTIKENISNYYKAFEICNNKLNKGDLTPFVMMFLEIIDSSEKQLCEALTKRERMLSRYEGIIDNVLSTEPKEIKDLCYVLIQASLFSELGIPTKELEDHFKKSYNTISNWLNRIPNQILKRNKQGRYVFYNLNLEEFEKLSKEKKA